MQPTFTTYTDYLEYSKLDFQKRLHNYLSEKEILKIPTDFIEDPIINLSEFPHKFIFSTDIPNYLIRKTFAEKLAEIDKKLEKTHNYRLKLYETYRPLKLQRQHFEEITNEIAKKNPSLSSEEIWEKTTEFIADPDLCPPHSTGGAVDLLIINETQTPLDFGTPINSVDPNSNLFANSISKEAQENRSLLINLMLEQQIAPLCTEWWHYSYGEAYWAALYGKSRIYDSLDL